MSKGKAVEIKRWLSKSGADARLYRLIHPAASVPKEGILDDEDVFGECISCEYVVVSAVTLSSFFTRFDERHEETFIFPSNPDGKITDYGELPGSFSGGRDHAKALGNAGYEVEQS